MSLPIIPATPATIQVNQGFSPQVLEKFNQHMIDRLLWTDNRFHKEFMRFIDNSSINDTKQIIHIYNRQYGKQVDFTYKSEYDILIELSTIVKSMAQPVEELQALFHDKINCLLPVDTHSWIMEDLDAILFFLHATPANPLNNRAFKGGREIIAAFENFIQFYVVDHGWNDGQVRCLPIEFANPLNKGYFLSCFEQYKKWYLGNITPRKEFKWLEKCSDSQLDSLIDNLERNNLRILKGVFHPVTTSDKISLIIASLNSILSLEDRDEWVYPDIDKCQKLYREFSGHYTLSTPSKVVHKGRNSYIKQFYEASGQKRHRDSQSVSEEERTIKILKKNMPILEKLAKKARQSKDKFINDLIIKANTTD